MISSLPTFMPRPTALCGLPFKPRRLHEIGSAEHQPRGLRTADALAAAEDDEIGPQTHNLREVGTGRQLRGSVNDHRHAALVGAGDDLDQLLPGLLTKKVHHRRRTLGDGANQFR